MRVIILSLDKTLFNPALSGGDALERHLKYSQQVEHLDIIVPTPRGFRPHQPSARLTIWPTNSFSRWLHPFNAYRIAKKIARTSPVHLVVSQEATFLGIVALHLSKKFNLPLLVHFHGDPFTVEAETPMRPLAKILARYVARRADKIRCVSQELAEIVAAQGVKKEKIEVISTPVNLEQFATADAQEVARIKNKYSGKKIILFVGRLVPLKNIPLLIAAMAEVVKKNSDAVLLLVGAGAEEGALRRLVAERGLQDKVFFEGEVTHAVLPAYYKAADVFALASHSEAFGKVLIEATMAGLPLVATTGPGPQEIIQEGRNGFLVPQNDAGMLAKRLLEILSDPGWREKMGDSAKELVQKNYGANTRRIVDLWEKTTAQFELQHPLRAMIITRRVDKDDALAGFTYRWIEALAPSFFRLEVICLEEGNSRGLPENVAVHSMGKEKNFSRWRILLRFKILVLRLIRKTDVVFAHQNPEYAIIAAPIARIFGRKTVLWYTHGSVSWRLRLANFLSSATMTASPESFRLKTRKAVYVMGHGIAQEFFDAYVSRDASPNNFCAVGRISPRKNYEVLIEAMHLLKNQGIAATLDIIGGEVKGSEKYFAHLKELVAQQGLEKSVRFLGAVPNAQMPDILQHYGLLLHPSATGSLDKAALEAAAAGAPIMASGKSYESVIRPFGQILSFAENDAADLAARVKNFLVLSTQEQKTVSQALHNNALEQHSLKELAPRIYSVLQMYRS